jgi:HD-GYP domain-containing protein (c-di-GMP phosphodiesterase class II)
MSSHRPYRPALGLEIAINELQDNPALYDQQVVSAATRVYESGQLDL